MISRESLRQLGILRQAIRDNEKQILDALYADLRKSNYEAYLTELGIVFEDPGPLYFAPTLVRDMDGSHPIMQRDWPMTAAALPATHGSIDLQHVGHSRYRATLRRSWKSLAETAMLRREVAARIVDVLTDKVKKNLADTARGSTAEALVDFSANELEEVIRGDVLLHTRVQKPLAAIDHALMFLHEHKIITLQQCLTIFRQAMTIRLNPQIKGRQYTTGDFKPLDMHYRERRFQVHVIAEYATLAMDSQLILQTRRR